MLDLLPCLVLVPSLNRPQLMRSVVENIHATTPEDHRLLFTVSDDESKAILTELGETFIDDSDCEDRRYVTRMNKMVHQYGDAKTVFFGSDDHVHHPGWLTEALAVMATGPRVVVVDDMRNSNGTAALMATEYLSRAVFDAPGDAFYGGYVHNYADTEQFLTATHHGTFARAMNSKVEHFNPVFDHPNHIPWDDTYATAAQGWEHDRALFEERRALIEAL